MQEYYVKKIVGQNIKRIRLARKITQVQLAQYMQYSKKSMTNIISQIEKGRKGLTLEKLKLAAKCLKVHPLDLLSPSEYTEEQNEMILNLHDMLQKDKESLHFNTIKHLLKQSRKE